MRVENFKATQNGRLNKIIAERFPLLSYGSIQGLIRKKDVKVNGKRIAKDCNISCGDEVCIYLDDSINLINYEEIYEDENVLVVYKKRGIEVVSGTGGIDLVTQIKSSKYIDVFAVHRLDRNTEGLVIFAKNKEAKKELDDGFRNRTFEKYYLAWVYGEFEKTSENCVAYLKKDAEKSIVKISDAKLLGYEKIQTNYKLISQLDGSAILEVELITGKTHQIRAHMAHIGHFIIGDDKYGIQEINKKFGKKYQNLIAYKLILHFLKNSKLFYLEGKTFEIDKNKIDFLKKL